MAINFDLDGTLADLYGVERWLDYLRAYDETPYVIAKPLINLSLLARYLNKLHILGHEINVISWLSKTSNSDYDEKVTRAKRDWLKQHLPSVQWDNIIIVAYGTPKHTLSSGILFDDEKLNRDEWGMGAYDVTRIIEVLKGLLG